MWLLADSSYRWLVVMLHGTESLGQFAAAQNVVLLLNPLLLTVGNLTQSTSAHQLAAGGVSALRQMTARSTLLLAFWSGVALIAIAAIGGPLVELMFGGEYAGLGIVVATLCLGMFARIVALPVDGATVALQRGRLLVIAGALRLVTIVAAGVPLIAWRGLEGVGYAMAASAFAGAAVQWWSLWQEDGHA
jgi:O-antigen/teichoic acid export membrane protein